MYLKNYCGECKHSGYFGKRCYKDYITKFVDGCSRCGKMVNSNCYFIGEECPDFDQKSYSDPSGS